MTIDSNNSDYIFEDNHSTREKNKILKVTFTDGIVICYKNICHFYRNTAPYWRGKTPTSGFKVMPPTINFQGDIS